jgi:hypothetical protein
MGADVTSIAVGSKAWASKIRKRAKDLADSIHLGYLELSQLLWTTWDTPVDGDKNNKPIYTLWGYDSFAEYAQGELEMDVRKAQKLRKIGRAMLHDLNHVDKKVRDRLLKLGWSKLYELCRLFQHKNDQAFVEKWLKRAEESSYQALFVTVMKALQKMGEVNGEVVEDVRAHAKDKKGKKAEDQMDVEDKPTKKLKAHKEEDEMPDPERTTTMNFFLVDEQIDNVHDALERADELVRDKGLGNKSKSARLALICLDFLMTNDFKKAQDPEMRKRYLAKLEDAMGIKLVGINEEGDVFYGLRSLKKLSD